MIKNNKGITMVALSATILIIVILTGTLVYNTLNGLENRRINNLYNDIRLLKDKVASYYAEYGELPISIKYPNTENIVGINKNDNDDYYVIDLTLLSNITLSYGKGFDKLQNERKVGYDIYIINKQSHNIYYPQGVKFDNVIYYTMPSEESEIKITSYDKPYIPEGCIYKEGTWETGFVIRQTGTDNEFVWIPVTDYDKFVEDKEYADTAYSDTKNGYAVSEYHYQKMLESVKENGGFYIGRYEMGKTTARTAKGTVNGNALSTQNAYPYNFVTLGQAQTLGTEFMVKGRTTSLMYGVQWDAVLRFIAGYAGTNILTTSAGGSGKWGNYSNSAINFQDVAKVKYAATTGTSWIQATTNKATSNSWILTTGASTTCKVLNIYDLAGNVSEYTLERGTNASAKNVTRGGNCGESGTTTAAATRAAVADDNSVATIGFRIAIW